MEACIAANQYFQIMPGYNIYALGDHAITIELGTVISEATNQQCIALAAHISAENLTGILDIIPAYTTVSVIYDPVQVHRIFHTASPSVFIREKIENLITTCRWVLSSAARDVTIPVCFDHSLAPDLDHMSRVKQLPASEIVNRFTQKTYRVYMLGFLPGFAYMGTVDDDLAMPRKESPHIAIPAGSVGIAGNQTGIYPMQSPGGWNIIGRTPLKMFNAELGIPCLLQPGDNIIFREISPEEFDHLNQNP